MDSPRPDPVHGVVRWAGRRAHAHLKGVVVGFGASPIVGAVFGWALKDPILGAVFAVALLALAAFLYALVVAPYEQRNELRRRLAEAESKADPLRGLADEADDLASSILTFGEEPRRMITSASPLGGGWERTEGDPERRARFESAFATRLHGVYHEAVSKGLVATSDEALFYGAGSPEMWREVGGRLRQVAKAAREGLTDSVKYAPVRSVGAGLPRWEMSVSVQYPSPSSENRDCLLTWLHAAEPAVVEDLTCRIEAPSGRCVSSVYPIQGPFRAVVREYPKDFPTAEPLCIGDYTLAWEAKLYGFPRPQVLASGRFEVTRLPSDGRTSDSQNEAGQ